jgi:hypothetical protein
MYVHLFTGKIGLFYLVFYGVLAALVAICFWGFFQTLDPRIPRWQLERSIIGTNPGKLFLQYFCMRFLISYS